MSLSLLKKFISMRIILILAISSLAFLSCRDGETSQSARPASSTANSNTNPLIQDDQNVSASARKGNEATSEYHYICVNNCEGSGANAAGTCPVCGEELVHNTSFHSGNQDNGISAPQPVVTDDNSFSSKITPLGEESTSNPTPAPVTGDASFHYICSAGCGGGGNAQGPCPSCGAALVHNAAFHANQGASAASGTAGRPSSEQEFPSVFNTPGAATSAPSQNTSGAFHYLCSAGCGGGGNAQGACPSCGAVLVHNDAYHQ